jgi:hypothetical protein
MISDDVYDFSIESDWLTIYYSVMFVKKDYKGSKGKF